MTRIEFNWNSSQARRTEDVEIVEVDGYQLTTGSRSACWAMLASCVAAEMQPVKPTRLAA